ncbi:Tns4 [Columba guinea]|nr:Tns4 [Columba guinea]
MSQVIHNHVLRVGQTVCVSSQEESKSLHLAGYPGCSALPMKCTYYSTESWADAPTMVHTTARLLPSAGLYEAHPVFEHVAAHTQGKGQQEGPTAPPQPKEEDAVPETHLESPTLDISIESLNQLILEIDPTFQPLTCKPVRDAGQPASRGDAAATDKQDPEGIDIKYIEMTPGRALCPELLQGSPSPSATPFSSSTHSLHNDDSDAHAAASPSPASSMGSPHLPSPSTSSRSGEAFGLSPHQPRATGSIKATTSPSEKGQASSCPPSILNSAADIPVLLVNGCLEQGDASSKPTKASPVSVKQSPPPSCSPASRLGGLNNALSAPVLSCVPDSPLRAEQPTMKFVMDTSKYWFKPSITRDQAIQLLRDKEPGTFVVRDSTSYRGSFGLAMKVPVSPSSSQTGSLSAFVYQHAITPLALPCKLSIPTRDLADGEDSPDCAPESAPSPLTKAAVCNVLYLNSVNVETLTGAPAIQKAISSTFEMETLPTPTLVHFRVTEQGVTLTDIQRKVFFRRHYPLASIRFCGMDPENRKWQKYCKSSRIFGFVAKSQTDSENLCHLFAEYDTVQPASLVIDLLCKLLTGP